MSVVFAGTEELLQQARQLYVHENYEEALEMLKGLSDADPASSETAFYLGMTHKRLQDYRSAQPFLEKACTLAPRVDEAVPELIELLYQTGQIDQAREWIGFAEREFIAPANVAFLKGLVLLKADEPDQAVKAFDDAAALDPSLAGNAAYQKAAVLSRRKDYTRAREQLRSVVVKDPSSDLAVFANEYIDALKRQEEAQRRIKASISYALQYDDNVIFKPTDPSLSTEEGSKDDWLQVVTAQTEAVLVPARVNAAGLNAVYSFYGTRHNDIGLYDTHSHDISLQPAYYTQSVTVALPVHYNAVRLNTDSYLDAAGAAALINVSDSYERMWQFQLSYDRNDYHWTASNADENRDSDNLVLSAGRYWFRDASAYLNLYYAFEYNDSKGRNWEYAANKLMLTSVMPLRPTWQWNLVGEVERQDYLASHSSYHQQRRDTVLTVSNLLVKELYPGLQLQAQHTFVYDRCNIAAYKYRKNIYSLGAKCRF